MSAPRPRPQTSPSFAGRWLQSSSADWTRAACHWLDREATVVRVVVVTMRGSVPREPGACMLVSAFGTEGTIGGGNLEWQAIQSARELLADASAPPVRVRKLVLGVELGQCCGGVVQLWLERLTRADLPVLRHAQRVAHENQPAVLATSLHGANVTRRLTRADLQPLTEHERELCADGAQSRIVFQQTSEDRATLRERLDVAAIPLWIFGAGHVGQALVRVLHGLPFRVTWVDSRAEFLPADVPPNVIAHHADAPVELLTEAPRGAYHLVMTHDHVLDYELCRAILERGDAAWVGLIGSASKGARFRSRLARDGVPAERIARLVCPIGIAGIDSKLPAAIAVGVVAQLLQQSGVAAAGKPRIPVAQAPVGDCSMDNCASCSTRKEHGS